eukprot:2376658-Pleurochrysis_carterae.AAC.2
MLTTGARMLRTCTSARMQPEEVAMRLLAYNMNGIIYVNDCKCGRATRAPYYVEQMIKQIVPAHADAGQTNPTRDCKGFGCTSELGQDVLAKAVAIEQFLEE